MAEDKRILILEPVPTDAQLIELALRKSGVPFTSKRAVTKDDFDRLVAEFMPDLVVTDHAVPRCDVLAMLRQSKQESPDIQWIIVTGVGTEDLAVAAMKAGAADYVSKKNLARLGAAAKAALEAPRGEPAPTPAQSESPVPPPPVPVEVPGEPDFFRAVVENANDLIAVLDTEGKRIYNNRTYAKFLDEPDTLEGTSSFVDVHPDDRERIKTVFRETVATGVGQRMEYRLIDREGNTRHIESQGSVIRDAEGSVEKVVIISRELSGSRPASEILRVLQEDIAGNRAEDFFPGIVRALAETLGVEYALVSEVVDRRHERVRALAYWASGSLAPSFEYDLSGTTCEEVVKEGRTMYFPENVQELFPGEAALAAMNAYCYLGTPLINSKGYVIGHMFVIHDRPMPDIELARTVLDIASARAAVELEHRQTVHKLLEREMHYRLMLEGLPDGVILTDMEDVITYVNHAMADLVGHSVEEMNGKLASTLLVSEADRRDLYAHNERRRRGVSERYPASFTRKDGTRVEVMVSAAPFRSGGGEVTGMLAVVTPREERPAAPLAPPAVEAGLLEKAQDAVFLCDRDDHILFWNEAAARLYGWSADEVRGKSSAEILHIEHVHHVGGAAYTALIEGYWAGEMRLQRKDGSSLLVDSRWTLVRDEEGHPASMLVISDDITGRKELEVAEMRRRRMERIATLTSAVASDLESMLTPMTLAVPALAKKADDDPSRQAVSIVTGGARRGMDLANQLTALSEHTKEGKGLIDPARLLSDASSTLSQSLPPSISLEWSPRPALWPVGGDPAQLQQALLNICTNSREAMPDGGILHLAANNIIVDAQTLASVSHALPGRYVELTVSDTGHGIPPELLGRVVEPFVTTKPPGRTTGLGLSTAAAIIKSYRGFLNVFSEPGKGTTVKMYLPAGERDESGREGMAASLRGSGERILVAHAGAAIRDLIKNILGAYGYDTLAVTDGAEAIAHYRRAHSEIAAVLIDLDMPFMDASTTIRVLKRSNPSVRIITAGTLAPLDPTEVAAVLPKPFTTSDLINAIRLALTPPA